ncbi:MAG: hypothetical protein HYY06_30825 [Deltaproteobacteria bacterium]|nr:hypothetical protein [Deltaproteobacteria bacterium]
MRAALAAVLVFSIATAWTVRSSATRDTGEPAVTAAPGGTVPVPDRPEQPETSRPPAVVASVIEPLAAPLAPASAVPSAERLEFPGFPDSVYRPPIPA